MWLDAALNTQLTREKAAIYAREALGRFFTGKTAGTFELSIRNAQVTDFRMSEQKAVLTVCFSRDGLVARPASSYDGPMPSLEKVTNTKSLLRGNLFTAKDDELATLQSLVKVLEAEIPPVPKKQSDAEAFFAAIAQCEELGDRRFKQFRSAVEADLLLLTDESVEILEEAKAAEDKYLNELKDRVKKVAANNTKFDLSKKFSNVNIDDDFRPYLEFNPLLMEVTGAKVIEWLKSKTVIIAVASTVLKDNSEKEKRRARKICEARALAYVVAAKQDVQVIHVEQSEDKTRVVVDEKGETATSVSELLKLTRTRVEGITKHMPVVGTWQSKDGEIFYLAIGKEFDTAK